MDHSRPLVLGAVAYDPKVVTIWDGFKAYFQRRGLPFDYVLYSNYERQVEALLAGQLDLAWNSPLAWLRSERLARASGQTVRPLVMRDTDRDLTSVIIVRATSALTTLAGLRGLRVGVGAIDSPQATLLPLECLRQAGIDPDNDCTIVRHDRLAGKHGDHVGGERDAARALLDGAVDAACLIEGNYLAFCQDGTIPADATRLLSRTGRYDHCNLTVGPSAPAELVERLHAVLLAMSYDDPEVRPLFELEGLTAWCDGRVEGYQTLAESVDHTGFYDRHGSITAGGYTV